MKKEFSIQEAFKFGWETTKNNFGFLIGAVLIIILWNALGLLMIGVKSIAVNLIFGIIQKVVSIILTLGLIKISLKLNNDEKGEWADLYNSYPLFWKYLGAAILMFLAVVIGTLLLIVPGIIVALMFSLFIYLIVDKNLGPIESLKKSYEITKGAKWNLFLFTLATVLLNLLGVICLVIGLLITTPVTLIAWAYVYKKLDAQTTSLT